MNTHTRARTSWRARFLPFGDLPGVFTASGSTAMAWCRLLKHPAKRQRTRRTRRAEASRQAHIYSQAFCKRSLHKQGWPRCVRLHTHTHTHTRLRQDKRFVWWGLASPLTSTAQCVHGAPLGERVLPAARTIVNLAQAEEAQRNLVFGTPGNSWAEQSVATKSIYLQHWCLICTAAFMRKIPKRAQSCLLLCVAVHMLEVCLL